MCELLEAARKNQGNISYYEVGKRLGISSPLMNKWKHDKTKPNGINTLKLAEMAGVNVKEAIKLVEGGFSSITMIIVIAVFSAMYFLGITQSSGSPTPQAKADNVTMYIMLNRILTRIRKLFRFNYFKQSIA